MTLKYLLDENVAPLYQVQLKRQKRDLGISKPNSSLITASIAIIPIMYSCSSEGVNQWQLP